MVEIPLCYRTPSEAHKYAEYKQKSDECRRAKGALYPTRDSNSKACAGLGEEGGGASLRPRICDNNVRRAGNLQRVILSKWDGGKKTGGTASFIRTVRAEIHARPLRGVENDDTLL